MGNVSHKINHLSFGERAAARRSYISKDLSKHVSPLDGQAFVVERFHEAPQHYLKVVSTQYAGKKEIFYQLTHTDRVRKLKLENKAHVAPQAPNLPYQVLAASKSP